MASFEEMTTRVRAFEGCLDFAVTADALEPGRVNVYERWASEDRLARWRAQADPPRVEAPMRSDHVRRFDVAAERDPFD
ncbi:putative quinol monooxygenase [Nocardioides sp. CFH 31398]|uniref:putative quinol monooxygenase n=1 Tax=Nocardioides sp. CFH 31398 TaxID=2919579 RepID=UPI001F058E2F|nr:antibiotic biosynthesis monooxygenase [Nocardioides sp. CFH 31398]MCH1868113.1 antibiotic biosynthesis monooxygenase [Nocardioides sp. CFH 31398]